jgi:hypothetical protein
MTGAWAPWYEGLTEPQAYGDLLTYEVAAAFLADCATVADWGTGKGWFKTLRPDAIGVDGTASPFADVVTDLTEYREPSDGILLRHVLEHNYRWDVILSNAAECAQQKLCVVLFTPCGDVTREIAFTEQLGVPDMSFALSDIFGFLAEFSETRTRHLRTNTQYGTETVILATR